MATITEIQVRMSKITEHRVEHHDTAPLVDGQVLIRVDRFSITANNVTYAAFGDAMKYWNFFPTAPGDREAGWGIVPVWGFGDVVESRCDGIEVGSRHYGYYPMATHLVVEPARVTGTSFLDGSPHRRDLHTVYNQYLRTSTDPSYDATREAEQMLLRPLFTTSFLIDDFLGDNNMFDASTVVLSSASSKTSYGTAFCLHRRGSVNVVGLTSERNRAFTESLGCYHQVVTYDDLSQLAVEPTVYVDMSGDAQVRFDVHRHLGDELHYDCAVGGTHWDATAPSSGTSGKMVGPRPEMFFAPSQVSKRNVDWGPVGFQERLGAAWTAFLGAAVSAERPWITPLAVDGADAVAVCFASHAAGEASPEFGHVASVHDA
jgi:hypothetical protein